MKLLLKSFCRFAFQILIVALTFSGCRFSDDYPTEIGQGSVEAIVLNEGRIYTNMGAISVIYKNGQVTPDVFRLVNNRPLGDVAQSITMINGRYFVALNNSKKIEIVHPKTFKSEGTILYTQAGLPRQIVAISDTTAIVSDLLSNNVANVDLPSQLVKIRTVPPYGEPLEYIPIDKWVEYVAVADRKLFGMTASGLYVFDVDRIDKEHARVIREVYNEEITKTCKMLTDKNGMIWALMNESQNHKPSAILLKCVNPHTEKVIKTCRLPFISVMDAKDGDVVGLISYNRTDIDYTKNWIFFNVQIYDSESETKRMQAVYKLNITTGEFQLHRKLPGVKMMYGCGVSPRGEVYICDCLDYSAQRGYVRHYKSGGGIESFRVGVYPSQIYFPEGGDE